MAAINQQFELLQHLTGENVCKFLYLKWRYYLLNFCLSIAYFGHLHHSHYRRIFGDYCQRNQIRQSLSVYSCDEFVALRHDEVTVTCAVRKAILKRQLMATRLSS